YLLIVPPPPSSTLFPYTTLFRSSVSATPIKATAMARPSTGIRAMPTRRIHGRTNGAGKPVFSEWRAGALAPAFFLRGQCSRSARSEEHTSDLQSLRHLVVRLLLD